MKEPLRDPNHTDAELAATKLAATKLAVEPVGAVENLVDGNFGEELIDRPPDTILWIDSRGHLFSIQDAACDSLGYRHEELLGMSWSRINPRLRKRDWPRVWKRTRRVGQWVWRTTYRRKDGVELPVEVTASFMTVGQRECVLAVARDITALLHAERERRHLEAQILHTQKLESVGILAGGIAHDFNNLLVGILGNTSLGMMKLPPDSPSSEHFREVEKTTRRASDLAGQMLSYSGKGEFVVEVVRLNELIREMAQLLGVSISKKAVLELRLDDEDPLMEGDATQVRQVVMNLLTNASEAIGNTAGAIEVSTGSVDADRAYLSGNGFGMELPEGRYSFLEVRDSGCGMDEETRAKIFDPFFTTKATGRGLGMAAVVNIVRTHGGAIRLDSTLGEGSTFRILFPMARRSRKAPEEFGREERLGDWSGRGSVLIVDDEEVIRMVAGKTLLRAGFEVLNARDGVEALEIYKKHAEDIVAVLLDVAMPRLDGIETLFELRCQRPDLRVLLSSGYNEKDIVPAFTNRRFSSYLKKPYKPVELVREIRGLIERRAPANGNQMRSISWS